MNTICAISTAPGGAIGIVRVSGGQAIPIVDHIFVGRRPLTDAAGYSVHFGNIIVPHDGDPTTGDEIIDQVLLTVFRAPHSYTGEDSVEISAHGSTYILQRICQLLIAQGCLMARPGEFTQRAYLNGKMDLSQAEAVADLIASRSASSHRIAMRQMRGSITARLATLRDQLLQLTSLLELELDFSEEEVTFADRQQLLALAGAVRDEIQRLSNSFAQGNALRNGIPVAIIGAPNVGKSTLLNALLQDDKAIVSDIQGTTRDTIEDTITIGGILFRFIDTAGIRHTDDTIESLGIERSLRAAQRAQIILLMRDPATGYPDIPLSAQQHVIRIVNKSDDFQALTGLGMEWLHSELLKAVPATSDDVIITSLRHKEALDLALADISRVLTALTSSLPGDLIAEDLRQCLTHLADITGGQITPNEVLANIFSHFCIGK